MVRRAALGVGVLVLVGTIFGAVRGSRPPSASVTRLAIVDKLNHEESEAPATKPAGLGESGSLTPRTSPARAARTFAASGSPTFGQPTIVGVQSVGFEEDLRLDPTNSGRVYASVPGSLSSDTSWIWRSLDGGKTFKWVVGATALEGNVTTCFGGGDNETGVDAVGHLYFADLMLANFSTSSPYETGAPVTAIY